MREFTAQERKDRPLARGVLDYFPDALLEVANVSRIGNEQHNPGQPMHWAKEKSTDEADALMRHLIQRGTFDSDGVRHSAKVAWRALAMLQRELDNAPVSVPAIPVTATEVQGNRLQIDSLSDYLAEHHRSDSGELPIPPAHYEGEF